MLNRPIIVLFLLYTNIMNLCFFFRREKLKQEYDKFQIIQAEWSDENEEGDREAALQAFNKRLLDHQNAVRRLIAHSAGWIAKDIDGQIVFAEMLSSGDFEPAHEIAQQRCKILLLDKLDSEYPTGKSVPHLMVRGVLTLIDNKMPINHR